MGFEGVGKSLGKDIVAWTRTSGKSLLASSPVKVNTSELRYVPKLQRDVVQISKKLVPADTSLFPWAVRKPEFSMTKVNPDSLVLVHMTNYYPSNGRILSTNLATKASEGAGCARTTIHFALNKPVTEHALGNPWNTMDYAIIAPFKETVEGMPKSKVIGGIQDDFFFQDAVQIPKGSSILKYNPDVTPGNFVVSEAFDGIKLIETSNRNLNEAADIVIQKMGYTTYNDSMRKFLGASEDDMKLLISQPAEDVKVFFNQVAQNGGASEYKKRLEENLKTTIECFSDTPGGEEIINQNKSMFVEEMKVLNLYEKYSEKFGVFPNSWREFCSKENYLNGLHSGTPWFKAEMSINGIGLAEKFNGNSWGRNLKQIFINNLNNAEESLPKGKSLGYDVKKVIKIIEDSETPKIANERLQQELKLKPMLPKQETQEFYKDSLDDTNDGSFLEFALALLGID